MGRRIEADRFARIEMRSAEAFEAWLKDNHAQSESVWLVTWKKLPGAPHLGREQVLDALVAWGWIDGVRRRFDDARTMQLVSPESSRSGQRATRHAPRG